MCGLVCNRHTSSLPHNVYFMQRLYWCVLGGVCVYVGLRKSVCAGLHELSLYRGEKLARILRYRGQASVVARAAVVDNIITLADFIQNA